MLVLNGKRDGCKGRIWWKRDRFLCPTSACCFLNQNHSLNLPTSSKVRIFLLFILKNHQRDTNKDFVFGQVHVWEKGRSWKPKHERVEDLTHRWHFWDINQREREISKGIIGLWVCCKRYSDYAPPEACSCTRVMTPCLLLFLALHYKCQFLIYPPCQYTLHPQGAKLRFYRSAVARLPPLQITIEGEQRHEQ